ncbi:hypothetical protein [Sphingobacterium hotanense]|uniref:hypothetical protein n=1 Tax=Sphingobacterium hotanense TaxID=649196 RepID=UPI0021A57D58|nr:hypothetical protein [Sphingobacterium hotanense]MCT1522983.1 hypothetical protein [Sphingobacterium hotanense]
MKTKSILLALSLCCLLTPSQAQFQNHGPQVFAKAVQGSHFMKDKQGKEYLFTVVRGIPGRILGYELSTGNKILESELTGTDGSWDMTVSTDNILYATGNGHIYSYKLGDTKPTALPLNELHQKVVWDLHPAENGVIYGGTYPDGLVFKYHPKTGFEEVSGGPIYAGENYVRGLVYNKNDKKIYAGTGSNAKFILLDPKTKQKTRLLPHVKEFKEFFYDMDIVYNISGKDLILGYINSNTNSQNFVYDIQSKEILRFLPPFDMKSVVKDPKSNTIYYTSRSQVYALDLGNKDAEPIAISGIQGAGKAGTWTNKGEYQVFSNAQIVYRIHPKTKQKDSLSLEVPNSPIHIQTIYWGPDDKVWSAGYLAGQHGSYDPKTGEHQEYPGLHQTEGMSSLNNKLYFGIYTKAHIYSYDLTKPWKVGSGNPKHLGQIKDQDRPFAVITRADRNELIFGTVPPYGELGGSISHLDAETEQIKTFENVIPNQSIISLLNHNGRVFGGSSISGGLGILPTEKRGKIFEWDPERKQVLWTDSIADYWSISGLFSGPNGHIWGFADGTLFEYDPDQKKVIYELPVYRYPKYPSHIWRNGLGVYHPNGMIYFTLSDSMYSFDPKSKKLTKLRDNASLMILGKDNKLYFRKDTDLWSYTPEQKH